jgi:hypothetical protein
MKSSFLVNAQFGIGRKKNEVVVDDQQPFDLDDPEFQMAIDMFSKMSPEEMEETMLEMKQLFGDNAEMMDAIEEVLKEIPKMNAGDIQSSLKDMISEDEIQAATFDALRMLKSTENAWEKIWQERDAILETFLSSGQVDPMDAARFQNDPKEWESELKHIWAELQKDAATLEESTA